MKTYLLHSRLVVLIGVITAACSAPAAGAPTCMGRVLAAAARLLAGDHEPERTLLPDEKKEVAAWAARYPISGVFLVRTLSREQNFLLLAELSPAIRRKLFSDLGRVSEDMLQRRLERAGAPYYFHAPMEEAVLLPRFERLQPGENGFECLEARIAEVLARSSGSRAELKGDVLVRIRVDQAKDRLRALRNPEYRLKLEGGRVVLPDGTRHSYGWAWGGIRMHLRAKDILRAQSREWREIVRDYRENQPFWGWTFDAFLSPCGRAVIFDKHHRLTAYLQTHRGDGAEDDVMVPLRIMPESDGRYYALTHWEVLSSMDIVTSREVSRKWDKDMAWSFLKAEERDRILEASEKSAVEALRDVFYRELGRAPLPGP